MRKGVPRNLPSCPLLPWVPAAFMQHKMAQTAVAPCDMAVACPPHHDVELHEAKPADVMPEEEAAARVESQSISAPVVAQPPPKQRQWLKYASLALLVLQNSALFVTMRYNKTAHDDEYATGVVVMLVEMVKLVAAFALYARQIKQGPASTSVALWTQRRDLKLLAIPALCYTGQQNLLFWSATYLSAPALQAIGQSKTIWTAVFSFFVLRKRFSLVECSSFVLLCVGVILVEHQDSDSQAVEIQAAASGHVFGVLTSSAAAALSGFAGVFLEKVYTKSGSTNSLWAKNVHLAIVSMPLQAFAIWQFDRDKIAKHGLFHGFHLDTALVIAVQSIGGLLTGYVIKYAGNILKNFATALAILTTSFITMLLFGYRPGGLFWVGMIGVCVATTMYGMPRDVCTVSGALKSTHRALAGEQKAQLFKGQKSSDTIIAAPRATGLQS